MNDYVIRLISSCLDGIVTEVDGSPISPIPLSDFATGRPNVEILDDSGMAWPDLYFRNRPTAPVVTISGVALTGVLTGSHPTTAPSRPK